MIPGIQSILGMIAGHVQPADTLAAICRYLSENVAQQAIALFVLRDEAWVLAAHSDPAGPAESWRRQAATISAELFAAGPDVAAHPFEGGWACHLQSGAGELLGMLAGLCHGPALPYGSLAARLEESCRLAVIALEQENLMTEVTFLPKPARPAPPASDLDCEVSIQHVARMIAQLRPPNE